MKAVTRDQAAEFIGRCATTIRWGDLDGNQFQRDIIELAPQEFGHRLTMFLKNSARLAMKGLNVLTVDRAAPFKPEIFISEGWSIVGNQDDRALEIEEVDFSTVSFEHGLVDGELTITGEEKLTRLKAKPLIRLDAKVGHALFEESRQVTLRFIYETYNVDWIEFAGTELLSPGGRRYFLYLYRHDEGFWRWACNRLDGDRGRKRVSPVLANQP